MTRISWFHQLVRVSILKAYVIPITAMKKNTVKEESDIQTISVWQSFGPKAALF